MSETEVQSQAPHPAQQAGMGALLNEHGADFRVWAPHAAAVYLTGTFNDWQETATPLAHEADGYWSVFVEGAKPGDEYQYRIHTGEHVLPRNDPYAREATHSAGNSVVHDPRFDWEEDGFHLPPWNELVIYELHIGTFAPQEDGGAGTFASAIGRLDYLRDLGINAVELMPVAEFSGDTSLGYNPAFPFAVEQAYGGPLGLKHFVKEAHRRGIAVFLDVVYNHFGPDDLVLWQFDGWHENGKGGIYFYNDDRAHTPWGDTRPDFGRPEVQRYLLDNVALWLDEYRMDGLRLDMIPYIYSRDGQETSLIAEGWSFLQALNGMVSDRFPGKLIISEDMHNKQAVTLPLDQGGAGFGAQWDANFVHPVRKVLTAPSDEARDLHALRDALCFRYGTDAFSRVVYTESHDEVANGQARVPEEIHPGQADSGPAQKRSNVGAALTLTAPGIPMLFQGQELLEDQFFRDTAPLNWGRLEAFGGIHRLYRDLIALRRNYHGVTAGLSGQHIEILHFDDAHRILAYLRRRDGGAGDDTVVVVNLANQNHDGYRIPFPGHGPWALRFNSDWGGYINASEDLPTGDYVEAGGDPPTAVVTLAAYTVLLYSQDP